ASTCANQTSVFSDMDSQTRNLIPPMGMYQHLVRVTGRGSDGNECANYTAQGGEGSSTSPATTSDYIESYVTGYGMGKVIAHETGHNFVMSHDHSLDCMNNMVMTNDLSNCTNNEYGNTYSFMGFGDGQVNATQKMNQGWMGGCNMVKVRSSGSFRV